MLCAARGVERSVLEDTARWIRRSPGPIHVSVSPTPLQLESDPAPAAPRATGTAAAAIVDDGQVFEVIRDYRALHRIPEDVFLVALIANPTYSNWFSRSSPTAPRDRFVHAGDFRWVTTGGTALVCAHFAVKAIFNDLLDAAGVKWDVQAHEPPRGCFFDFCGDKRDLAVKLRTADICGDCLDLLYTRCKVSDDLLRQLVGFLEAGRRAALATGKFLEPEDDFDRWPFPVAFTRHKTVQASTPLLRFLLLLDHFDCIVRYTYFANELREGRAPVVDDRKALGWWVEQWARSLRCGNDPVWRGAIALAENAKIVNLRNERRGHGWMAHEEEMYKDEADRLRDVLSQIETLLDPFLCDHVLMGVRSVTLVDDGYRVTLESLIGSHVLHPVREVVLSRDPRSLGLRGQKELYLTDPGLTRFASINPYLRADICPECAHRRVLISDGKTTYIDVQVGHRVQLG